MTPKGFVSTVAGKPDLQGSTDVTTLAGLTGVSGSANGIGSSARFNHPDGIAVDFNGTVYVADRNNNVIRTLHLAP